MNYNQHYFAIDRYNVMVVCEDGSRGESEFLSKLAPLICDYTSELTHNAGIFLSINGDVGLMFHAEDDIPGTDITSRWFSLAEINVQNLDFLSFMELISL